MGLFGTEIQGATTKFAFNLKRILKLLSGKTKNKVHSVRFEQSVHCFFVLVVLYDLYSSKLSASL
ncbi:hypothetical protein C7B90_23020 [Lysinibacillus fusiformis]|nr:hypothetical protein C7B90_23020 [Lysinibacillus fusiformis]